MSFKVYRYETKKTKELPYNCLLNVIKDNSVPSLLCDVHMDSPDHQSWSNDGLTFAINNGGYRSACNSIKELQDWFRGFNNRLLEIGFVLVEYSVTEKIDGYSKRQCIFHIDNVMGSKIVNSAEIKFTTEEIKAEEEKENYYYNLEV